MNQINKKSLVIENILNGKNGEDGLSISAKEYCNLLLQMKINKLITFQINAKYEDGTFDPIEIQVTPKGERVYTKSNQSNE